MKSFGRMFYDSFKSLKDLRTLTTAGILIALAFAIRSFSIEVTPDLRIGFTFLATCTIGMLYGPVVCGMSTFVLDFLGYIVQNKSPRAYSPQLAMVVIISGIIYGCLLYKCDFNNKKLQLHIQRDAKTEPQRFYLFRSDGNSPSDGQLTLSFLLCNMSKS